MHGFERRLAGRHAGRDVDLRGFHDDDRVVHDQSDRQHQPQQRDDVDRESHEREEHEGADERHGNRHERNDRRAPVLNEEVDDQDHQHEGDDERAEYILDAGLDAGRRIHDRGAADAVRQPFFELCDGIADFRADLHGIAARLLIDHHERRRSAAEERADAVALASERDLRHVAYADLLPLLRGADHDVAELLGGRDLRGHRYGVGIGRAVGRGFRPKLSGGVDAALHFDGRCNLADRDAVVFEHVGAEPDAHGVLPGAHDAHLSHAVDLEQFVLEVDVGVVREELVVVAAVAVEGVHEQESGHGLLRRYALFGNRGRQQRRGGRHAVLREDGVQIGVRSDVERYLQAHRAVVGAGGLHVEHVAHAHDVLRHGRGHGIVHRLGVGPVVGGRDLHHGRRDVGILFDRERPDRDGPHEHDDHGQRDGEDGPRYEEFFHSPSYSFTGTTFMPSRNF